MATIKQVADRAQVSVATVSRVINSTGFVSPDLEHRVQKAMDALNYQPSALGRSLRRRETLTVGLLIPQIDHPFFSTLAASIEAALFRQDYRTIICSAEEDGARESSAIDILLQQRVDGVIYVPTGQNQTYVMRFRDAGIPVVLVDRDLNVDHVDKVLSANMDGGYMGIRHLLEHEHRRIGVIGTTPYSEAMSARLNGVKCALKEAALDIVPEHLVMQEGRQFELGYASAYQMLASDHPPTAIFALTDVIAIGVFHAASQMGLQLPQQLSVVGFDDIPLAAYIIPTLTTIAQPIHDMGEQATRLLFERIKAPDIPAQTAVLPVRLIERDSVAWMQA